MDCEDPPITTSAELVVGPSRKAQEFQEIIRTRKEEHRVNLEQVRQKTVKRIEESRLRNEMDSMQERFFGLPNEVWMEILSHVKDPRDLESMWNVHPRFRYLSSESQSLECLFSKVLNLEELPHLWEDYQERMEELKKFRGLSREMRTSVDRCLDTMHVELQNQGGWGASIFNCTIDTSGGDPRTINLDETLAKFREGPVRARAKRVFHRTIKLTIDPRGVDTNQFDDFIQKIILLLETIGHQIWNISFEFCSIAEQDGLSFTAAYTHLQRFAKLTPNLKWISVDFGCDAPALPISPETLDCYPFPCLQSLERLHFNISNECQQKSLILASILRSNLHLKSLSLEDFPEDEATLFSKEIKSLFSDLNLEGLSFDLFQIPKSLMDPNWKLKSLTLFFLADLLVPVFNFVNHFPTLKSLTLIIMKHLKSTTFKERIPPLTLPNLEEFDLEFELGPRDQLFDLDSLSKENTYFFFSLQFLLNSKKLKCLRFVHTGENFDSLRRLRRFMINRECGEETINFRGGFRDLKYSNLWDVFPELEYVQHSDWKNECENEDNRNYSLIAIRRPKLKLLYEVAESFVVCTG